MINKNTDNITRLRRICPRFEEVDGYKEAMSSSEEYILHHLLGETQFSVEEMTRMGLYLNRFPCEFKWVKRSEHMRLHMKIENAGRHNSPSTEFKKGHETWNKGKTMPESTRQLIRENRAKQVFTPASNAKRSASCTKAIAKVKEAYAKSDKSMSWNEFQRWYKHK